MSTISTRQSTVRVDSPDGADLDAPPSDTPARSLELQVPQTAQVEAARRIRVLIVDAHPLIRAGIRAVLSSIKDVELVGEGASSEDALRLTRQTRPDVVLLDVDMTDDSGVATIMALSDYETHPRVIALTILSEDETMLQALRAGASGLISKDTAEEDLSAALRAAASGDIYIRTRGASLLAASVRRRLPSPEERAARTSFEALSERERAVLEYVATGLTGPEIGQLLNITAKTVDTYRHRIREKINLLHRADYIRFALLIGLLKK